MNVYVSHVPDFDDDDNEVLLESVVTLELEIGYMREHFQGVVDLAYKQKPTASSEEVIRYDPIGLAWGQRRGRTDAFMITSSEEGQY
ncbi:hypothetical protein [Burkholderia sp. Bp8986]|uniref:hypothetical protein n=1 Tax=Burkholderia sp. Bp8986 TaxID=2184550 RepID=UPI00163A30B0|nr:hypothetical protein [Burkholderia sp. Bp8986]